MSIVKSKRFLHGAKVSHFKNTHETPTVDLPLPERLSVPMIQHMGAACEPIVKVGDRVYLGQKIGESPASFSAPVHAGASGTVVEISDFNTSFGASCKQVVIQTDGTQTLDPSIHPPQVSSREEFLQAVRESGAVGLGGAGFPTHVKLNYKDIDRVHTLVVNVAECEPYITSDYRACLEDTADIAKGVRAVKKYLGIEKVFIGVESNKPGAIKALDQVFEPTENVTVVELKSLYPQGAEKSIIYATTGITVGQGMLPADCGVIVMNVTTLSFIGQFLTDGIPLVSRRITVDGDIVEHPKNLRVPLGAPIQAVLDFCGADAAKAGKILMGGPMMGTPIFDTSAPIIKNNNAIVLLSPAASTASPTTSCIRCGKCIAVCPMRLMPAKLEKAYDKRNIENLKALSVDLCINCGCCTYICPAKRHLAQKNQLAKQLVKAQAKEANAK